MHNTVTRFIKLTGIDQKEFKQFNGSQEQNELHQQMYTYADIHGQEIAAINTMHGKIACAMGSELFEHAFDLNQINLVQVAQEVFSLAKGVFQSVLSVGKKMGRRVGEIAQNPVGYTKEIIYGWYTLIKGSSDLALGGFYMPEQERQRYWDDWKKLARAIGKRVGCLWEGDWESLYKDCKQVDWEALFANGLVDGVVQGGLLKGVAKISTAIPEIQLVERVRRAVQETKIRCTEKIREVHSLVKKGVEQKFRSRQSALRVAGGEDIIASIENSPVKSQLVEHMQDVSRKGGTTGKIIQKIPRRAVPGKYILAPKCPIKWLRWKYDNILRFKDKLVTIAYEHILGIEVTTITKRSGLVEHGWNGFHSDYRNELRKRAIAKVKSKVKDGKTGCYTAKVTYKGKTYSDKTFFPSSWEPEKVIEKIVEAYKNFKGIPELQQNGNFRIKSLTNEGIRIDIIIRENVLTAKIITAYPVLN